MLRRPFESAQYTSIAFGQRCHEAGVRPSMGSVGDCFDNAMCESFFATLECELLDRRRFKTQIEARMAVFEFIEGLCEVHGENVAKLIGSSGGGSPPLRARLSVANQLREESPAQDFYRKPNTV